MLAPAIRRERILGGSRRYRLRHSFSGAAVTPSDLGPPLLTDGGAPAVSGGRLTKTTASNLNLRAADVGVNVVAEWRVNFGASPGVTRAAYLRVRVVDNTNAYEAQLFRTGTTSLVIARRVAGAGTTLGSSATAVVDSTDYLVRFSAVGDRLVAELFSAAGALVTSVSVTDTTFPAASGVGLWLLDSDAAPTVQADYLEAWAA